MMTLGISCLVLGLVLFVIGLVLFLLNRKTAEHKPVEEGPHEIDRHAGDPSTTAATSHELPSEERS